MYKVRKEIRMARAKRKRALRRRIIFRFAVMTAVFFTAVFVSVNAISTVFAKSEAQYVAVTVSAGDNLWEIAQKYNTSDKDIISYINEILKANDRTTTMVYAGETLRIPK